MSALPAAASVRDAERNAQRNGISNVTFIQGDLERPATVGLTATRSPAPKPTTGGADGEAAAASSRPADADVVVVDPARGGLSQGMVDFLTCCRARRVVYVSCNPATQARDLAKLVNGPDAPFDLVSVTPVDMFPNTDHVETVVVLDRRA